MPNYKSKMLTFLSIGEMTGLLLDNTDEDGILFAVATDSTNFKIVMWRKSSTATVDNDKVYLANGPGRWHVLATGTSSLANLTDVTITSLTAGQTLVYNGSNWVNQTGGSGDIIQFVDNTLPVSPAEGKSICVVNKNNPDRYLMYRWVGGVWELIAFTNIEDEAGSAGPTVIGDCPGQIFVNTASVPKQVFIWNDAEWIQVGSAEIPLDGLTDVTVSNLSDNQSLFYTGTGWANRAVRLSDIQDFNVLNPSVNQILSYNGSKWVNSTLDTSVNLDGLTDVTITTPADNQVLVRQGSQWVNQLLDFDDLSDVWLTSPTNGQVLVFNGIRWVNQTVSGVSNSLDGLTDVSIDLPLAGNSLVFDGSNWSNQTITVPEVIDDLTNVATTSPVTGQALVFNGTQWVNQSIGGVSNTLDGLNDVTITSPSNGQGLIYNGSQWVNQAVSGAGSDPYPFVSSVSPSTVLVNNSTVLTLTGNNFTPSTTITIPDATISNIQRNSPSSLVLSVLASVGGSKTLTVSNGANSNMTWVSGIKSLLVLEGDPYLSDVTLFLRGDGTNGSTTIVDSSSNPKTITLVGNTSISTTQSKYGGSSIFFDGSGDLLQLSGTTAFNFGANNFTLEFWIYPLTSNYFVGKGDGSSAVGSMLSFAPAYGCGTYFNGGSSVSPAISFNLNQWQHIAIVRNGINYTVFKNGTIHSSSVFPSGATLNTVAQPLQFGGFSNGFIQAFFDSIRITNVARYTSTFDPETDTYLN